MVLFCCFLKKNVNSKIWERVKSAKHKSCQLLLWAGLGLGGAGEEGKAHNGFMLSDFSYGSTQWFCRSLAYYLRWISLPTCSHASSVQMRPEWGLWNETSHLTATPGDDHKTLAFTHAHLKDVFTRLTCKKGTRETQTTFLSEAHLHFPFPTFYPVGFTSTTRKSYCTGVHLKQRHISKDCHFLTGR